MEMMSGQHHLIQKKHKDEINIITSTDDQITKEEIYIELSREIAKKLKYQKQLGHQ